MTRTLIALVAGAAAGTCFTQPAWVEDFDDGVGRFDFVTGPGNADFTYNAGQGAIDAYFERRNIATEQPSRRLALLDRTYTNADDVGFSVEWTPLSGAGGFSWPLLGFFDSATGRDVGVVRVRDNNFSPYGGTWETSLNWGYLPPNTFNFNATQDEGFEPWVSEETYRLDFYLNGSTNEMSFEVFRLFNSEFVSQGSATWSLPGAEWAFDSVGVGNLLDDQALGGYHVASIDNFAFIPSVPTSGVLLIAGLMGVQRRRHTA